VPELSSITKWGLNVTNWIERQISWAQLRLWLWLGAMVLVGGAASVWGHLLPRDWAQHIARDLGPALFTTGLLGLTVHTFLNREIARDVFQAAFRYVLPAELKDEVARIITNKFICIDHYMEFTIVVIDADLIRLQIKVERTLKNITRHTEKIGASFALDEWGFPDHPSEIEVCKLILGSGAEELGKPVEKDVDHIRQTTKEVGVKSGETVKFVSRGSEVHRINGEHLIQFAHPTVNPVVLVVAPSEFKHSCSFGVQGKVTQSSISEKYTLDGTQFPGQYVRLRWWPANFKPKPDRN
jgi:hypothetical protein